MSDLASRLNEARVAVDTLEREHGVAALDGNPFDANALNVARATVAALEAAELEQSRRDAHAAGEMRAAERAEAAAEARAALQAYSEAVGRCEVAAKALADNLRAQENAAETLRRSFVTLRRKLPIPLESKVIRITMSRLLMGELAGIEGPCGYGDLRWPSVPKPAWSEHIAKYIKPAVDTAIELELSE